ncbi:Tctex-1 [Coemansia mojavensis]|nr:Tctex-1 [Coemansia mojavensis]
MTETQTINTEEVHKYLKAAVEMAVSSEEYQHSKVYELHNNIIEYATKKITGKCPSTVKLIVTCTVVENNGSGFHIGNSTLWDDTKDTVVNYKHQTQFVTVVVTAYFVNIL